jgi:hypothetical protein
MSGSLSSELNQARLVGPLKCASSQQGVCGREIVPRRRSIPTTEGVLLYM